ncbi:MAG: TIGR00725 family protein [Pseudomonadota bacterium]
MNSAIYVGIIGAGDCPGSIYETARKVGYRIGQKGWVLVCGGLGGVMEGAARGCREAGGMSVGILPGLERASANPYIQVALTTGLGDGRNLLVVRAADVLVAIAGGYGTLSEIGFALKTGKPVIGLHTWERIEGIRYVSDPGEVIPVMEEILL